MEQIVVKTEMGTNGEILLFYVNENGDTEQAVLSELDGIQHSLQLDQTADGEYILSDALEVEDARVQEPLLEAIQEQAYEANLEETGEDAEAWLEDDIKRLLVFYNDNKQTFKAVLQKTHLWTVACKTILIGKEPDDCETQLQTLKSKYYQIRSHIQRGVYVKWPFFELCHQSFEDEDSVMLLDVQGDQTDLLLNVATPQEELQNNVVVKKSNRLGSDEKVEAMLTLYLRHKMDSQKHNSTTGLWETIAIEMGEDDVDYWHKRFLNYKQHYIRVLEKQKVTGSDASNWPYTQLFDEIFADDEEFQRKFVKNMKITAPVNEDEDYWNDTENIVLVKYCFDCFDEFQDATIPSTFLWNEIGRLLDKVPEKCKEKYEELKTIHLNKYIEGSYNLRGRKPLELLCDHLISKETEVMMVKSIDNQNQVEIWKTEELDELVQFFYENIEMFKDPLCYFVCWSAVSKKLAREVFSCFKHWEELKTLYKSILHDKKENSDMQIDWRYIELFDRIFDYGMDTNLLVGYEQYKESPVVDAGKVRVKKLNIRSENKTQENGFVSKDDDSRYEVPAQRKNLNNSKTVKILEFYMKNKDKLSKPQGNKSVWKLLAKQLGITAEQCISMLKDIKHEYISYVQREVESSAQISWRYYTLCKKVFGYRAIKNKIKNKKLESDSGGDEWTDSDIYKILNHFSQNFARINSNTEDVGAWADVAAEIDKTEYACKEKFLELRKSYRKLRTRSRNPDVKIAWKYFHAMDKIYVSKEDTNYELVEGDEQENVGHIDEASMDTQEEEDFQCIIVIPEGQELTDIDQAQIIVQKNTEEDKPPKVCKWTKRSKKRLLILYINYLRSHKGQAIKLNQMWRDIASKLPNQSPLSCRKIFGKLKANHMQMSIKDNGASTPYSMLLQKILAMKPKFIKTAQSKAKEKTFKDVDLPTDKVENALNYYLQHIEEFASPRYEKQYLWTELAESVSEPVSKVYNKINFLRQSYNNNALSEDVTKFSEVLKEISAKEIAITLVTETTEKPNEEFNEVWTDEEIEKLLEWYLSYLDKFKNPKFLRRFLWMEVSSTLHKSPLACSKKMFEIRTQYRNMVRENSGELCTWRFHDLCQKIYGTGKKTV